MLKRTLVMVAALLCRQSSGIDESHTTNICSTKDENFVCCAKAANCCREGASCCTEDAKMLQGQSAARTTRPRRTKLQHRPRMLQHENTIQRSRLVRSSAGVGPALAVASWLDAALGGLVPRTVNEEHDILLGGGDLLELLRPAYSPTIELGSKLFRFSCEGCAELRMKANDDSIQVSQGLTQSGR